jgi:hypothetical protein
MRHLAGENKPLPYILKNFSTRIQIFLEHFVVVVVKIKQFIELAETSLSQRTGGNNAAVSAGRPG